jgi:hypothetical protein
MSGRHHAGFVLSREKADLCYPVIMRSNGPELGRDLDDRVVDAEQAKMHFKVESPQMNQDSEAKDS